MFTGIIENTGAVKSVEKRGVSGKITISTGLDLSTMALGESIAVNGACLTVTHISGKVFSADLSADTLGTTTLALLKAGAAVNLERALTLSRPLGGHLVTGHVDGVGVVSEKLARGDYVDFTLSVPPGLMGTIVTKGSVAIDGVSLTIAGLRRDGFTVALIPHTLDNTTLASLDKGSCVNIETDMIGKYVERYFQSRAESGVTEGFLAEHGFLKKG